MGEFRGRDRDDLVGKTGTNRSITGANPITEISGNKSATVRMVVGLSDADDGILVDLGGNTDGAVIYTWGGTLYASCGNGGVVGGTVELSWLIPSTWTNTTSRVVVVGFSVLDSSLNTLFVDGILRDSANAPASGNPSQIAGNNDSGAGRVYGQIAANRTTGNPDYEASSTIGGTQIWLNKLPYVPVYGGDKLMYQSGYLYNVFTTVGSSTFGLYDVGPITRPAVRYLVVAGGAGGGCSRPARARGGGGGGGGILFNDTGVTLTAGTYTVTVGDGGAGSTSLNGQGTNGSNSVFGSTATALGGGGGGSQKLSSREGASGGSGGGGSAGVNVTAAGSQGGDGGGGSGDGNGGGGGGGGSSGQNGETVSVNNVGGNGGNGTTYSWGHLGATSTTYAGGGGGVGYNSSGSGGAGGGGAGQRQDIGGAGSDIYGGGGGGGEFSQGGGDGGSGHVTLRVPWTFQT